MPRGTTPLAVSPSIIHNLFPLVNTFFKIFLVFLKFFALMLIFSCDTRKNTQKEVVHSEKKEKIVHNNTSLLRQNNNRAEERKPARKSQVKEPCRLDNIDIKRGD